VTWYEHACAYAQMKWPDLAAKSRRSTAESFTTITLALTGPTVRPLIPRSCAGPCSTMRSTPAAPARPFPDEITRTLDWIAKASLPVAADAGTPAHSPRAASSATPRDWSCAAPPAEKHSCA
jgi:hypothetical protein